MAYVTASLISQNGLTFFHPFPDPFVLCLSPSYFRVFPPLFPSHRSLALYQEQGALAFLSFPLRYDFAAATCRKSCTTEISTPRRTAKSSRYPPAVQPTPIPCWCHHQRHGNAPCHGCLRRSLIPSDETSRLSNPDGPKGDETTPPPGGQRWRIRRRDTNLYSCKIKSLGGLRGRCSRPKPTNQPTSGSYA